MFFGRGRRTILKTQFLMTLQSFFEFIRFEVRLSSMSQLTDTLFVTHTVNLERQHVSHSVDVGDLP